MDRCLDRIPDRPVSLGRRSLGTAIANDIVGAAAAIEPTADEERTLRPIVTRVVAAASDVARARALARDAVLARPIAGARDVAASFATRHVLAAVLAGARDVARRRERTVEVLARCLPAVDATRQTARTGELGAASFRGAVEDANVAVAGAGTAGFARRQWNIRRRGSIDGWRATIGIALSRVDRAVGHIGGGDRRALQTARAAQPGLATLLAGCTVGGRRARNHAIVEVRLVTGDEGDRRED